MFSSEEGATIYYTPDGTEPFNTSLVYEGPITLRAPDTVLVRAIMSAAGFEDSDAAHMLYAVAFTPLLATTLVEPADGLQSVGTQTVLT